MYDRPLFHIIGHRSQKNKLTVVWHHIIMDDHSELILRRDISALAHGEHVQSPDLNMYTRIAQHRLRAVASTPHAYAPFLLPRSRERRRDKVAHSIVMFAAVSRHTIERDMDRLRWLLDSWCSVTLQEKGRFGLLTNARSKVDEDATNLIGALFYMLEWSYNSTTRELLPLNCGFDEEAPGVIINTYSTSKTAEELLGEMGFDSPNKVVAGSTKHAIKTELSGALGVNFSDGAQVDVECVACADATVTIGMFNTSQYDALHEVQSLQRRWSVA